MRWTKFAVAVWVCLILLGVASAGAYELFLVSRVGRATSQVSRSEVKP